MKKAIIGFVLLLCCISNGQAQQLETKREREFTGSGLYGFMNGGADQFLEYGVSRLITRDLVFNGIDYTVDLYELPSPEDAYGIYSLHVFKCQEADQGGSFNCMSPYQWQGVNGNCYISIVFPSGTSQAKANVEALINNYVNPKSSNDPAIPEIFKNEQPCSSRLKFIRGPIGLSGVCNSLATLLDNCPYDGIWFVNNKPEKDYHAWISFSDPEIGTQLLQKIQAKDILSSGTNFLFIKGEENESTETDLGEFGF